MTPAPETVHEWQLMAAFAARGLDPGVRLPESGAEIATYERVGV